MLNRSRNALLLKRVEAIYWNMEAAWGIKLMTVACTSSLDKNSCYENDVRRILTTK